MWLYLPSMSSQYAPVSVASNSDCNSLTIISERLSEASVTWRGKLLPPQAWSRRWKRGGFITRLSGLTLEPSMAQRFADAWTSSLRAIRVRATALPESAAANSTTAGSLIALSTSSIKAGLILSSARTCRGTPTDSLPSQSRLWSDWAAALRSEFSARQKLATPCDESDYSSWPTAQARDYRTVTGREHLQRDNAMQNLNVAACHWMAPRTVMGAYTRDQGDPTKERPTLEGQAEQFFHPPSSRDQPIIAAGSTSSTDSPNTNQPSVKRKLNPIFVEALMRWPTGLSGFERQETALTRWRQQQLTFVSMLCSPPIDAQMQLL